MSLTSTKVVCLSSPHFIFFVCMSSVSQKRAEMTRTMNGVRTQERGLRTRTVKEGRGPQINQSSRLIQIKHILSLSLSLSQARKGLSKSSSLSLLAQIECQPTHAKVARLADSPLFVSRQDKIFVCVG